MANIVDDLLDRSVLHAVTLERYATGETKRILGFLQREVVPDITSQLERGLESGTSKRQLKRTLRGVADIVDGGMTFAFKSARNGLFDLAVAEAKWQIDLLDKVTPSLFNIDFNTPPLELLRELVTEEDMRGELLEDWFAELSDATVGDIRREINIGLAEGESIPQITRRISGTRPRAFKDGVMGRRSRQATSIVRTAVNHTTSKTRGATYEANSDIVKGEQWVATLDANTTDICASLDGKVFKLTEGHRPPAHHQCRSTTIPVLKSFKELGIDLKELPPGTRAVTPGTWDGRPAATVRYPDWLKRQPDSVQNFVLGRGRAELFRRGIPVTKFVDPVTLRSRPLNELISREGIVFAIGNQRQGFFGAGEFYEQFKRNSPQLLPQAKEAWLYALKQGKGITEGGQLVGKLDAATSKFRSLGLNDEQSLQLRHRISYEAKRALKKAGKPFVDPDLPNVRHPAIVAGKVPKPTGGTRKPKLPPPPIRPPTIKPPPVKPPPIKPSVAKRKKKKPVLITARGPRVDPAAAARARIAEIARLAKTRRLAAEKKALRALEGIGKPRTRKPGDELNTKTMTGKELVKHLSGIEGTKELRKLEDAWAKLYREGSELQDKRNARRKEGLNVRDVEKRITANQRSQSDLDGAIEDAKSAIKGLYRSALVTSDPIGDNLPITTTNGRGSLSKSQIVAHEAKTKLATKFVASITDWAAFSTEGENLPEFIAVDLRATTFRASAATTLGRVNVGPGSNTVTYVHELGHMIEHHSNAGRRGLSSKEVQRRGQLDGGTVQQLSRLSGMSGYSSTEVAYRDKFFTPYMGKVYHNFGRLDNDTEIVSMVLQELYENPQRIISQDPESVEYVLDLVRGFL